MLRRTWPVALACLLYGLLCGILYRSIAHVTDGRAVYPLDDTYIQAAIGRNIAFYHSYGISPHVFATASSSILWPFILALAYKIIGLHIWVPLAWNICFAVLLLFVVDRILRQLLPGVRSLARIVLLFAVIIFSSLATMTFVGMEHIMQAVAFLLFVYFAARLLESAHAQPSPDLTPGLPTGFWIIATAAFTTLSRFEGGFVVAIVCLLLLVRRRLLTAAAVALSGAVPLVLFAFLSIRHGGHALPNSLLMKAANKGAISHQLILFGPNGLIGRYSRHNGLAELWIAALLLCVLGILKKISIPRSLQYALAMYAVAVFLQCQLARLGWLGRYEFYLIVAGVVFCGSALISAIESSNAAHDNKQLWATSAGAVILMLCLIPRPLDSWHETVQYSGISYADVIQDGRFLHTYYDDASIVANDVGAISYLSHVQCLDLAGLGSNDVADLALQKNLTRATVDRLAHEHHARIALVFKSRFNSSTTEPDVIPTDWIEVGHISYPDFPALNPTYFMAVDPAEAQPLRQHMLEFFPHMPPEAHFVINP